MRGKPIVIFYGSNGFYLGLDFHRLRPVVLAVDAVSQDLFQIKLQIVASIRSRSDRIGAALGQAEHVAELLIELFRHTVLDAVDRPVIGRLAGRRRLAAELDIIVDRSQQFLCGIIENRDIIIKRAVIQCFQSVSDIEGIISV